MLTRPSYAPGETGSYSLLVFDPTVAPTSTELVLGESRGGRLDSSNDPSEDGKYHQTWTFEGAAGQNITVAVSSTEFDTYVQLVSPDETVLSENDDVSDFETDSLISTTLPDDGEYRVIVTSYAPGETGNYGVTLREAE